jgi:hypothetical protein
MRLEQLMTQIIASDRSDWHRIHCGGHGNGPSYRQEVIETSNGLETRQHHMVAVYKADASITMALGLRVMEEYRPDWNNFPDPNASLHAADIFFNGSLVHRTLYATVDGGRADLPLPTGNTLDVPADYARLIRLVDALSSVGGSREYFQRAGFREVAELWPDLDR